MVEVLSPLKIPSGAGLGKLLESSSAGVASWSSLTKGGMVYHVDAYGAVSDGATNSTAGIQAAIDAAAADGGGQVVFGGGSYVITGPLVVKSGVHIRGAGYRATYIYRTGSTVYDVFISESFSSLTGTDSNLGVHSCSISDLVIIGQASSDGTVNSTITGSIDGTTNPLTTVTVANAGAVFPANGGMFRIGQEWFYYESYATGVFSNIQRGINHTLLATHASSDVLTNVPFDTLVASATVSDSPLSSGATTVNVNSTTNYKTKGVVQIEAEVITYTGVTGTSLTGCTRGAMNTTAASHVSGRRVTQHGPLSGAAIKLYGYGYDISNVRTLSFRGDGIYTEWGTVSSSGNDNLECTINNVKCHDGIGNGILFRGPHDSSITQSFCFNVELAAMRFETAPGWMANGTQVVACHNYGQADDTTITYPYEILDAAGMNLIGCVGETGGTAQLHVEANDVTVSNAYLYDSVVKNKGLVVGRAGKLVTGVRFTGLIQNCDGGAVDLTGDGGGNDIHATCKQGAGTFLVGTAAASTNLVLVPYGFAYTAPLWNLAGQVALKQTWNDGAQLFRGLDIDITNTASAGTSRLLDLRVAGVSKFSVTPGGDIYALSSNWNFMQSAAAGSTLWISSHWTGTANVIPIRMSTGTYSATSGQFVGVQVNPTYNQLSGTGANTDLQVNRVETALGSGVQLLADFQRGGVSQWKVDRLGNVTQLGTLTGPVQDKGGAVFDVKAYGALGTWKDLADGSVTNSSTALTMTSTTPFSASDVGMSITIVKGTTRLTTTIAAYVSPSAVTLAAPWTGTTGAPADVEYGPNDYTAIQAAIDAAALGGGTVYFPAGVYAVGTTLTLKSYVSLAGSGYYSTIIVPVAGLLIDVMKSENFASLTGTNSTAGIHSFAIRDLRVAGHRQSDANIAANLTVDPGAGGTTITVNSTTGFPANGGLIRIENEVIYYESLTGTTFVACIRGVFKTLAVAHATGTANVQNMPMDGIVASATVAVDSPLSAVATTINVNSTTGYPTSGTIRIEGELITYTGVGATTFTGCLRGQLNTTAATHALGKRVVSHKAFTGTGLKIYGYGYTLTNVRVTGCRGNELYSEWSTVASVGTDNLETFISGCKFHDGEQDCVYWAGPHDSQIVNTVAFNSKLSNFKFVTTPVNMCNGTQLTNCHAYGLAGAGAAIYGYEVLGPSMILTNCVSETCAQAQLSIQASYVTTQAMYLYDSGITNKGLELGRTGNLVSGCSFQGLIQNCTAGAIDLTGDGGGNSIDAVLSQTSGTMVTGTPAAGTNLKVTPFGMALPTIPAHTLAGAVVSTSSIRSSSPTAGIGYSAGAGGAVTQATNKSTGVTLNTVCGTITMAAAALAAATTVSFTLTNSAIAATDYIDIRHNSVGTLGAYNFAVTPAAGSASIAVRNIHTASLNEAIVLRFVVIKAVVA